MKPYVTKEQIRAAKAVNTLAFLLRHQSEQFKRVGRTEYAHCGHDSLKVSSNGKGKRTAGLHHRRAVIISKHISTWRGAASAMKSLHSAFIQAASMAQTAGQQNGNTRTVFLWALTNREIRSMRGCGEHRDFFAEM